jgi:hypothetical protein
VAALFHVMMDAHLTAFTMMVMIIVGERLRDATETGYDCNCEQSLLHYTSFKRERGRACYQKVHYESLTGTAGHAMGRSGKSEIRDLAVRQQP